MAKRIVSFTLDDDVLQAVDSFASYYGLSRSAVVNMNLRAVLGSDEGFKASMAELFAAASSVAAAGPSGSFDSSLRGGAVG